MSKSVKLFVLGAVALAGAFLSTSCAFPLPLGGIYTNITTPVTVGSGDLKYNRCGTASCYSILGWVAGGDASLNKAALNGNLDKISWANMKVVNYLGIYGSYTVEAYGFGSKFGPDESLRPAKVE